MTPAAQKVIVITTFVVHRYTTRTAKEGHHAV